uniref:Uncharacterized protein n=1 Tax=Alexandrium catenella TaxID=2925 RepID=A0A7S1RX34_ALECA
MLPNEDFDSEVDDPVRAPVARSSVPLRSAVASVALLGATAVLALVSAATGKTAIPGLFAEAPSESRLARMASDPHLVVLDEAAEDPCKSLPFLRIMSIKSNNLGGKGPDTDQPEGLVYVAQPFNSGLDSSVEIHLHAVNEFYFAHSEEEGTNLTADYHPEWPKVNGITGHFATINVHPGTNVTCTLHGYDPVAKENVKLPKWAMTFFDLDTGKDGDKSVEYLRINNFKNYFVTNTTELEVRHEGEGAMKFTGTVEGTGDDNPDEPLKLTAVQKNRAVSFEFEGTDEVKFQLGASPGDTARVFQFVVRPVLRCAYTKLENGTLLAHDSPSSPIEIVKGGSEHSKPVVALAIGLVLLAVPRWF